MTHSRARSRWTARAASLLLGLVLGGCGGGSGSSVRDVLGNECSIAAQNQALYQTMQQYYLWYDQLPQVNPASFASPEILLEALRFSPTDRFSYLTTVAEEEAMFGASQFVGFGFRTLADVTTVQVTDVFENAPADKAGLVRGSRILEVNGVPIAQVLAAPGGFSGSLGRAEVGVTVTFAFVNPDGTERLEVVAKDVVTIPPVTAVRVFEVGGKPTGHLVLRNFVQPSIPALDAAFAELRAAGVTQLVIDLRYNGGGLVRVMEHLANLLGSRIAPGAVFARYLYNDRNAARNESFGFRTTPLESALDLERLVIITTPATASASEMLINGMDPVVDTATVGRETFGKPVGQLGFQFCERVLRPVSFRVVNGLGQGDYFDGIPPVCPAGDTLEVPFGTAGEDSFDTAVFWLEQGFCPPAAEAFAPMQQRLAEPAPAADRPVWRLNDAH
jgi:carboxyl-terminal processing protease